MKAAAAATARGGSLPMPSRKEWRAVSDHHSARNPADDLELERSKLGQSDGRTIYEHGREPADVDFCAITVDEGLDDDILQQRIHTVSRQREELQQIEVELRAQMIARADVMEMQNTFNARIKEHEDAAANFQEQLREREQAIHDLERRMEEKDRELHAIRLDNEAAWAKQDLLREQNKELATFRREHDHSEAERAQHIQQIHDLQEHIQEKERQIIELQEQHRADQEAIFVKDDQLKVWIARAQELDALQSTTNHSLQSELRERTEQYNQLWMFCQRQFAEMERFHLHTVHQLQLELAGARERNGSYPDDSHISQSNSKDVPKLGQSNGNQLDGSGNGASNANNGVLSNGSADNVSSFASTGNVSNQANHVAGVPLAPSSLVGMPTYLPPGQMSALHPFLLHQQGLPQSVPSPVPQSHVGHPHSMQEISSLPQWQSQQAVSDGLQLSIQDQLPSTQTDHNLVRLDAKYDYQMSADGHGFHSDYLNVHMSQGTQPDPAISSSTGDPEVVESIDRSYMVDTQPEQRLELISSQFKDALRFNPLEQNSETKEQNSLKVSNQGLESPLLTEERPSSAASASLSEVSITMGSLGQTTVNNGSSEPLPEAVMPAGQTNFETVGKVSEPALLDERSLLACIVRTIPAGGRIGINSTLPNRLGKMLAPLHWHDYKKKYGKLENFVASHPELFLIEGDFIQLREGAQEIISATAAVAKVAAAAATSSPHSAFLPSVAVTPMAHSHRPKRVTSIDSKRPNGVSSGISGASSNVKILSKPRELREPGQLNGPDFDSVTNTQSRGAIHGRPSSSFAGNQQGRASGAAFVSRT